MARMIREKHYEDDYLKYECHGCCKSFIVGRTLSENCTLACPYCRSEDVELVAAADESCTEEMGMGCVGIYFGQYRDGSLMLYTTKEFNKALIQSNGRDAYPLDAVSRYCAERDRK